MDRRHFVTGIAVATLTSETVSQTSKRLDEVKISLLPILNLSPLQLGMRSGIFAKFGIRITIAAQLPGRLAMRGLAAGQFDISFTSMDAPLAMRAQAADMVLVAGNSRAMARPPDGSALLVRSDSSITSWPQLEGRTVLTNALYNINWAYTREAVFRAGGSPERVLFQEAPFSGMLGALRRGQVDAISTAEPVTTMARLDAAFRVVGYQYVEVQPRLSVTCWASTGAWIRNNSEVAHRFRAALAECFERFRPADSGTRDAVVELTGVNPQLLDSLVFDQFDTTLDLDDIRRQIDVYARHGAIATTFNPAAMVLGKA